MTSKGGAGGLCGGLHTDEVDIGAGSAWGRAGSCGVRPIRLGYGADLRARNPAWHGRRSAAESGHHQPQGLTRTILRPPSEPGLSPRASHSIRQMGRRNSIDPSLMFPPVSIRGTIFRAHRALTSFVANSAMTRSRSGVSK